MTKGSPNLPLASKSSTPSLPAAMQLQPAAHNCATLRSGRYRLVVNAIGDGNAPATEVLTIDASKLTVTDAAGEVSPLTANGACRFRTPASSDAGVSPAGVLVAQINCGPPGSALNGGMLFPEQSHPLASRVGDWNLIGLDRTEDNGPVHLTAATGSLNATGQVTAITQCDNVLDCVSLPAANLAKLVVTANAAGGFDFTSSFLRDPVINLSTGLTQPERFAVNQLRQGYSRRTGGAVTDSAGQPSTVQAFVAMGLRGSGVTPVTFLGNNQLVLSVSKP